MISNVSVPEDLVQIQAYLRWEKNGKQMYTPEQEKASENIALFYGSFKRDYHLYALSVVLIYVGPDFDFLHVCH